VSLTARHVLALGVVALLAVAAASALAGTPRANAARPVAIVGHTVVTEHDVSLARRSLGGTVTHAGVVASLVQDAVLVDEARRLGLLGALSVHTLAAKPASVAALNSRLYGYAARSVPLPADKSARTYAKLVADAAGEDADAIEDGVGTSEAALTGYDNWLTRRDQVASAWFGRLYARYRALTTYPTKP
jgi:hypothetical protein